MRIDLEKWKSRIPIEPRTLLALGVVAGLLLLLAKIVEDVVNNESGSFDHAILMALRVSGDLSTPVGPAWLQSAFTDITALGSPTVITLITIISAGYLAVAGKRRLSLLVVLSIGLGATVEKLMKFGFDRARPDIVPHFVTVHTLSFPSGHATLSAMTYLTIAALLARSEAHWRRRIFVLCTGIGMTLLIGFSRVYLGVHWPTDVLAGWTIGALWALVTWMVAEALRREANGKPQDG